MITVSSSKERAKIKKDRNASAKYNSHVTKEGKTNSKNIIGAPLGNDNKLIGGDIDMASIFNSTFSSVLTKENITAVPTPTKIFQGPDEQKFTITEIDAIEMRKHLQKNRA